MHPKYGSNILQNIRSIKVKSSTTCLQFDTMATSCNENIDTIKNEFKAT